MSVTIRGVCRCCHRTRSLSAAEPNGLCDDCGHCCTCGRLRRLDLMEPYGKCGPCRQGLRPVVYPPPPRPRAVVAAGLVGAIITYGIIAAVVKSLFDLAR